MIIRHLEKNNVFINNQIFLPPEGYVLDYADSHEGIYSYKSERGHWRSWSYLGENFSEFVPDSYFVKLSKLKIIRK